MSKLEIKLDNYKEFFYSEHGLKLISQIIESGDYGATKKIAKWKKCPSKVLDKIAIKYMTLGEAKLPRKDMLEMLECVAENPKISVKMLGKILNFAVGHLEDYRYEASGVLEEIAESKKLTADIAAVLYKVALENSLDEVIEELAENQNTPDNILYNIFQRFDEGTIAYRNASEEIIIRYKKLKELLAKEENN